MLTVVLGIAVAVMSHIYIKKYFKASLLAALIMVVLIQIISFIELGYIDPFWLIALPMAIVASTALALIVGLPFKIKRNLKNGNT